MPAIQTKSKPHLLARALLAPLVVLGTLLLSSSVQAAPTSTSGSGISVSPGILTYNLGPNNSSQSVPLTISNGYDAPVSITAAFKGIDENADLLIPVDALDPSFAAALAISQTEITLPAHSSQVLNVQVTNLSSLSAGGHYATLVLTQEDLKGHALSIKGAVSLTIFAVKNPGAYQSITLTGLRTNHSLFRLPTTATLNFSNSGNVLIIPRATVLVFNHDGHTALQKGVANITSHQLLPGKELQSNVKLGSIAHAWLPQRVQLEVAYRADGASLLSTATASFWYIPPIYLLLLLIFVWPLRHVIAKFHLKRRSLPTSFTRVPPLLIVRGLPSTPSQSSTRQQAPTSQLHRLKAAVKLPGKQRIKQPKAVRSRPLKR